MTDDELIEELRGATDGVLMMSEADHSFEIITLDSARDLTPERLRELTDSPADAGVTTQSVGEFFGAAATNYADLVRLLNEHLTETQVYRVGERNVSILIAGRAPGGKLLGVSTRVAET